MRKILFVRTDRMGDLLMNVPVLRRLRQNYPKSYLAVLCRQPASEVLKSQPDVDELIELQTASLNAWQGWKLFWQLRRRNLDCIVISNPNKWFHCMSFALGIPIRVGYDRKWGFFLNHRIRDEKDQGAYHEIDYNLRLVNSICPKAWDQQIRLGTTQNEEQVLTHFGVTRTKPYVVFHVSTSNPSKQWSLAGFNAVIARLLRERQLDVVRVGDARDACFKELSEESSQKFHDLAGRTNLTELAAILRKAACVVSLDSGPYHLAWMQHVPVVGLFIKEASGSHPRRWGVYPEYGRAHEIYEPSERITPETVYENVMECLV